MGGYVPAPGDLIIPEVVPQTPPGAGLNFTYTCEPAWIQRLLVVTATFVADANVADRTVLLEYLDGNGNIFYREGQGAVVQATTTETYSFNAFRGDADFDTNGFAFLPLLPIWLTGGQSVRIAASGIQATDQFSAIRFTWERYLSERAEAD